MKKRQLYNGEELWKQFLAGNKPAFSLIYKNYVADLFQFGLRISPNKELVKDTLQELFVSLWNKQKSLPAVDNVKSYYHPILRMPNVICTPHLGYVEREGYELYFGQAFQNLIDYIDSCK